jgi:hypothetical protein
MILASVCWRRCRKYDLSIAEYVADDLIVFILVFQALSATQAMQHKLKLVRALVSSKTSKSPWASFKGCSPSFGFC